MWKAALCLNSIRRACGMHPRSNLRPFLCGTVLHLSQFGQLPPLLHIVSLVKNFCNEISIHVLGDITSNVGHRSDVLSVLWVLKSNYPSTFLKKFSALLVVGLDSFTPPPIESKPQSEKTLPSSLFPIKLLTFADNYRCKEGCCWSWVWERAVKDYSRRLT